MNRSPLVRSFGERESLDDDFEAAQARLDRPADAAKAFHTAIDVLDHGAGRGTPTLAYVELDLARAEHTLGHEEKAQSLFRDARRILNTAEDEERERQRQV